MYRRMEAAANKLLENLNARIPLSLESARSQRYRIEVTSNLAIWGFERSVRALRRESRGCIKYEQWRYEDEVRLILGLDEGTIEDGSCFYAFTHDLALREVILGPLCQIPIEAVRLVVNSLYQGVIVKKARLAFKWFTVVPDERSEPGSQPAT